MATLSGNKIKDTYQSLVKFSDNGNITASAKQLTDGFGNNSPLFVSTTQIGIGVTPTVQFHASGNGKFGGNLTVVGDLVVEGSTTTVGTDTLTVKDPLIVLANNNTSTDAVDIGFYGKYHPSSTTLYSGFFRDAGDGKYKLFKDLQTEPTTTVDTSGTGYAKADLVIGNLEAVVGTFSGNITSLGIDDNATSTAITIDSSENVKFEQALLLGNGADTTFGPYIKDADSGDGITVFFDDRSNGGFRVYGVYAVNGAANELFTVTDQAVKLNFDNSNKLITTLTGVTVTGNVAFDGLTDTGESITITKFVDEADGIGSNDNDTSIPTSAAVKDYVDTQVDTADTLSEILAIGNTTGGTDIKISTNDKIDFDNNASLKFESNKLKIISSLGMSLEVNNGVSIPTYAEFGTNAVAGVELFTAGQKRFETTETGATVTGPLTTTGNVLIGANINSSIGLQVNKSLGSGNAIGFFRNSAASGGNGLVVDVTNTPSNYIADFRIGNSSKVRIDSSGNVGIGTDSPDMKIDVEDNSTTWAGRILNTNSNGQGLLVRSDSTTASNLVFAAYGNGGYKMVVRSDGRVGIGETNPAEMLTVKGGNIRLESTSAGNNGILRIYDSNTTESGQIYGSSGDLKIYSPADVLFNQAGNVGIGIDTPTLVAGKIVHIHGTAAGIHLTDTASGTANTDGAYMAFDNPHLFIQNKEAGDIRFETSATTQLTIDSSGNSTFAGSVGIGGSPSEQFEVFNDTASAVIMAKSSASTGDAYLILNASGTGAGRQSKIFFGDSADLDVGAIDYLHDSDSMQIRTAATTAITIDSSQKVGIGTTSPIVPLHIVGTAVNNPSNGNGGYEVMQVFDDTSYATGVGGGIGFGGNFTSSNSTIFSEIRGLKENATDSNYAGALTFSTRANGANITERARITSGGNINLGTGGLTQVSYQLRVDSDFDNGLYMSAGSSSSNYAMYIEKSSGGTSIFNVRGDGNVGIGVDSPDAKLTVNRSGVGEVIRFTDSVTDTGHLDIVSGGGVALWAGGFLSFGAGGGGSFTERMRLASGGQLFLFGQTSGTGNSTLKYTTGTGAVTFDTSSRLVKENIEDIPYGLDTVLALSPKRYNRIDSNDKIEIGFIADEVQKVVPELVGMMEKKLFTKNEEDTEMIAGSVEYEKMTAILVKSIQELKAEIETLKTQINK